MFVQHHRHEYSVDHHRFQFSHSPIPVSINSPNHADNSFSKTLQSVSESTHNRIRPQFAMHHKQIYLLEKKSVSSNTQTCRIEPTTNHWQWIVDSIAIIAVLLIVSMPVSLIKLDNNGQLDDRTAVRRSIPIIIINSKPRHARRLIDNRRTCSINCSYHRETTTIEHSSSSR